MYDAIVIGARCAGSPTAMRLARKGYRVLLIDKSTFPSDHISTHFIWPAGVVRLKRWGLLDPVRASNCPPVTRYTLDLGEFQLSGSAPPLDGVSEGYAPRRTVLDKILVDAASQAGADVREGFSVEDIAADGDRVTGILGRGKGGSMVSEQARIVIGADGIRSVVARKTRAPEYNCKPPIEFIYYTYWSGVPLEAGEVYLRDRRAFIGFPTNDGLVCLPVAWPVSEFSQYRSDIEGNYLKTLDLAPQFAERVRGGKREERFYGTTDVPNFFRKAYGPGWALVGDAGYHKDPITAQGITDAFRGAELLAEAVDDGFSGRRPLDEALARYEQQRNDAAMPMYESTCQRASLKLPPPEMMRLFRALRGNQTEIDRFWGTDAGTVPIPEFFSQENIDRILAGPPELSAAG